jgi:hypothetical protein
MEPLDALLVLAALGLALGLTMGRVQARRARPHRPRSRIHRPGHPVAPPTSHEPWHAGPLPSQRYADLPPELLRGGLR